jgi:uncharacterized radical SAM superfamily Fe-S cluster-containing enzyme
MRLRQQRALAALGQPRAPTQPGLQPPGSRRGPTLLRAQAQSRRVAAVAGGAPCRGLHEGRTTHLSTAPRAVVSPRLEKLRVRLGEDAQAEAAAPRSRELADFLPPEAIGSEVLTDKLGREHRYLRISLTERCSLRCTYCMPAEGVPLQPKDSILSTDEVVRLAEMFVAAGITKIRLTGGEPLVHPDIVEICQRIGALPGLKDLGITTNGLVLEKKLADLQAAGVNQLNVSLDTLVPEKFEFITRRKGFSRVVGAIEAAIKAGYHHAGEQTIKVNVCVMNGFNEDELSDFVGWCVVAAAAD